MIRSRRYLTLFNQPGVLFFLLFLLPTAFSQMEAQENFEALYNSLKAKIEKEETEPRWPELTQVEAYIKWMGIKAADRDKIRGISLRANQAGNPYWEKQFLNLALDAQQSGELTLWQGVLRLMRGENALNNRPESWSHCVFVSGPNVGEKLYNSAVKNGFSTEDVVERARCLMRHATNDLEANWLYTNHESFLGHYDANNYRVLPTGDWSDDCMRRGEFTTTNQGEPLMPADKAMEWAQEIRDICEFYNLKNEYDDATDLMVQYLKEKLVLCVKPPEDGHQWYMDLSQEYKLDKALEYMEGFYATIRGKIEREKNGKKEPVPDAEIEFEAPKDQRIWTAKSDQNGNYKIEGVILHKSCSPFILSAQGDGCFKKEEVQGPLEEPDKSFELEKNLLLDCEDEYVADLTIRGKYIRNSRSSYSKEDNNSVQRGRADLNDIEEASFYVPLKFERADDLPIFNQRWEYYRPLSIKLSSCYISSRRKEYSYASSKTGGFEQTMTLIKDPLNLEISGKETIVPLSNIILVIDKESDKVVKIITGGYAVDFYWHERYQLSGESWTEDSKTPINKSENKTDDISSQFTAGPVEDQIPDPTIKSVSQSLRTYLKNLGTPLPADIEIPEDEEQPEISPDLLVEFGDGKTSFGGDGKVVLDDKHGPDFDIYSEKTFYWQIKRRKKP